MPQNKSSRAQLSHIAKCTMVTPFGDACMEFAGMIVTLQMFECVFIYERINAYKYCYCRRRKPKRKPFTVQQILKVSRTPEEKKPTTSRFEL